MAKYKLTVSSSYEDNDVRQITADSVTLSATGGTAFYEFRKASGELVGAAPADQYVLEIVNEQTT